MAPRLIRHAERLDELRLRLDYDDGASVNADFEPLLQRGGRFQRLQNPEYFDRFSVVRGGRALEWSEDLDFYAIAWWLDGQPAPGVEPSMADHGYKASCDECVWQGVSREMNSDGLDGTCLFVTIDENHTTDDLMVQPFTARRTSLRCQDAAEGQRQSR